MIKRFFVLLLAAAALGGGVYVLRGRSSQRKAPSAAAPADVAPQPAPRPALPPTPPAKPSKVASGVRHPSPAAVTPRFITPRIAVLLLLAGVLGGLSYAGLGESPHVSAGVEPVSLAVARQHTSQRHDESDMVVLKADARAATRAAAIPTASPAPPATEAVPPPPAPTPAVAAEVSAVPAATPTPEPVAAPAAIPQVPTDGFEAIVCSVPWPCDEAIAVAACESGRDLSGRLDGNWATNGIHYGLFQISAIHAYRWGDFYDNWMDPAHNVAWAYELYAESGGWGPWHCKPWF